MSSSSKSRYDEPRNKGSYLLRLPTGQTLRFRDASHRAACWKALTNARNLSLSAFADLAKACPNGYTPGYNASGFDDSAFRSARAMWSV